MSQAAREGLRWTIHDIELLPENDWVRHEIIDGELFATRAPHLGHQRTCGKIFRLLDDWSESSGLGEAFTTPGIIYTDSDNVIPDVIWISHERLAVLTDESGHLAGSPELVVEVLSPGKENERRDREAKLKLYSQQGVREYWIADWQLRQVEVYRREAARLTLFATLLNNDELTSPLLPGFNCSIGRFFA